MTFEEFFQKKKIDLKTFGAERPALLEEFIKHFAAMGEKSFDHTKKYWFNKLRKSYPLKELPASPAAAGTGTPLPAAGTKPEAETASPAGAPNTPPVKPGFKPRFRAGKTTIKPSTKEEPATPPNEQPEKTSTQTKGTPGETEEAPQKSDGENKPAAKPAYKPRFRPGVTPAKKKDAGE